jgi:uridine phosphorylase
MGKQPHLLVGEGELNEIALLPGDPNRVGMIAALADEYEVISENREYKICNIDYKGKGLTVCSTGIGCPSAAIAVEELCKVGVKKIIRVGTTGALQKGIKTGEFIIVTGAAKEEGTTKRYESEVYPAVSDYQVVSALVNVAKQQDHKFHVGAIVTNDAYYAETEEYVKIWENAGLLSIEMETSVILTLARRLGIEAGSILTVDGNLVEGSKKGETEGGEFPKKIRDRIQEMGQIALDASLLL